MKHQILDEITTDLLHRALRRDEKIIWEGQPYFKFQWNIFRNDTSGDDVVESCLGMVLVLVLGFLVMLALLQAPIGFQLFVYLSGLFLISPYFIQIFRRNRTRYLVSNQRVLFQLSTFLGKRIHSIPLEEIKNIVITQEGKNYGTIFFALRYPENFYFETQNLRDGSKRHQPTFEMIQEVERVGQHIQKAIRGNL